MPAATLQKKLMGSNRATLFTEIKGVENQIAIKSLFLTIFGNYKNLGVLPLFLVAPVVQCIVSGDYMFDFLLGPAYKLSVHLMIWSNISTFSRLTVCPD